MKFPDFPPAVPAANIVKKWPQIFAAVAELQKKHPYLHWNDLRRRPIPAGLSHEEIWGGLKFARKSQLRSLPLRDKAGKPFQLAVPDLLADLLHQIDRGLGFAANLPDAVVSGSSRDQYIVSTLMQESITSSQLEGAATTRVVAKEMLRSGRPPRNNGERMIVNNYRTMQRVRELCQQPLTPEMVRSIHVAITEGTLEKAEDAGRIRRAEDNVRVESQDGETVFHLPPPAAELSWRLKAMCEFANGSTPDHFVHPVVRGIVLHFWLAYDHPFVDGNGRTARALFYWSMLRQGYSLFEFISISQILLRAPARYAESFLLTETDGNDLTYFVLSQADVIREAVRSLHEYVAHKTRQLKEAEKQLRGLEGLNHRQQALLAHALRASESRFTIQGHARSHDVSFPTASADLFDLVGRGLLTVSKEGRFNIFRPPSDAGEKLAKMSESRRPKEDDSTLPLELPFLTRHDSTPASDGA